jgi:hypothetical protein
MRIFAAAILTVLLAPAAPAQVIEFESNGLRYLTLTRNGMTIMFAHLPVQVRGYSVLQVAVSNGSSSTWVVRPEDFLFRRSDAAEIRAASAHRVVGEFLQHGGRDDVVKLVTAYETGLYGVQKIKATNGYEQRRQSAMAELTSTKLKAAAAASAIVLVPVKMKPGESTDGAIFYPTSGKPLGTGRLVVAAAGTVFEFETESPPLQDSH